MAQLLREGLELPAGLTVLAGENGSGKSTVTGSLGLVALLHDLVAAGSQMVVATHSPIVAALLELGPWESGPPPGKT